MNNELVTRRTLAEKYGLREIEVTRALFEREVASTDTMRANGRTYYLYPEKTAVEAIIDILRKRAERCLQTAAKSNAQAEKMERIYHESVREMDTPGGG